MGERDSWFFRMKAAQRELIRVCGGIEAAAAIGLVSAPQMGRLNNVGAEDLMSARVKARLEGHAGDPIVSRVEIEALGWSVVTLEIRVVQADDPHVAHARVLVEAADVARAYAEGCRDGRFSPADAAATERELAELARAVEDARLSGACLQGKQRHE